MSFNDIKVSIDETGIVHIQLTREEARNALRNKTLSEIASVIESSKNDETHKCIIFSGSEAVFAAGADIKELQSLDPIKSLLNIRASYWKVIREFPKPLLAAVNGYALGGGCELMMHCDIVVAGENALFGQPEISLGVIPGAGGTQRLVRTVGKSLAMRMILTGEFINAKKALDSGLITEVCPKEVTLDRAMAIAKTISSKPSLAIKLAKQAILNAYESPLEVGLELERHLFAILAASKDREEGINAFLEKRNPDFKGI